MVLNQVCVLSQMVQVAWLFWFSKIIELIDTVSVIAAQYVLVKLSFSFVQLDLS